MDAVPEFIYSSLKNIRMWIYLMSIAVAFPLYVYVYRMNRARDRMKNFYSITNHFYLVVCGMQSSVYLIILIIVTSVVLMKKSIFIIFLAAFLFFSFATAVVVTSVQNILLFFLALRRFVMFFFPSTRSVLAFNRTTLNRVLITLYLFYSSLPFAYQMAKQKCVQISNGTSNETDTTECMHPTWLLYLRIYIAGDVLVMLSTVLYVILLIRVRNWNKLSGHSLNHPEQYIFYQTLLIFINKSIGVGLAVIQKTHLDDGTFGAFLLTDISTTPFVIQISYLCCNRSNIETILSIQLKKVRTWQVLCCAETPDRQRERRRRNVVYGRNRVMDRNNGSQPNNEVPVRGVNG